MPQGESIERDGSAPPQQADAVGPEYVDLVGLLADEFGVSRTQARLDLLTGHLTLDGESHPWDTTQEKLMLPRELAAGKTVEVTPGVSGNRTYRFQVAE